jgi:methylphosphotriester-DNA--protein-cysteine methyltransferase/quercetin dioxygenase-like cupin family protein
LFGLSSSYHAKSDSDTGKTDIKLDKTDFLFYNFRKGGMCMNTTVCGRRENPITRCDCHTHNEWEIILHLTGEATAVVDGQPYALAPGTVMVIPPRIAHYNFSDQPYTDMFFQAKDLDFFGTVAVEDIDSNVTSLMNMLHKVLTEKEDHYANIADNLTCVIVSYIKKLSKTDFNLRFVNDLKNCIYENISNVDFDLCHEIRKTGYNPDYLRRCFKKVLGRPPLEYLTMLRIERAKILLTQHTFTGITDTAYFCGFNDSYYFSTCFKKHVGVPPLQYRKTKIALESTDSR